MQDAKSKVGEIVIIFSVEEASPILNWIRKVCRFHALRHVVRSTELPELLPDLIRNGFVRVMNSSAMRQKIRRKQMLLENGLYMLFKQLVVKSTSFS